MHPTKKRYSLPYVLSTSTTTTKSTFSVINTLFFTTIVMSTLITTALVNAQMDPFSSLPASVPHLTDSTASSRFNDAEDAVAVSIFRCICSFTLCFVANVSSQFTIYYYICLIQAKKLFHH